MVPARRRRCGGSAECDVIGQRSKSRHRAGSGRRRRLSPLWASCPLGLALAVMQPAGSTLGQPSRPAAADALVAVASADPLDLDRVVARVGDPAVLALLERSRPRDVRLAAIRACPHLGAPERALDGLTDIAKGRDPLLAPAAALSLARIATALSLDALGRREASPAELAPVATKLDALIADGTARSDILRAAALAREALRGLGIVDP